MPHRESVTTTARSSFAFRPSSGLLPVLAVLCLAGATTLACQGQSNSGPSGDAGKTPTQDAKAGAPAATLPEQQHEDFDPETFSRPTVVDNAYIPMKPGTRYTYEGTTIEDDGTAVPHRVVINVTDLTKVIGGVRSVVTWDLDYSDNELVEAELAFFAQDNDGNVWRMGEYPEEYEDAKLLAAPTWIHGIEEAVAGIEMRAKPEVGSPSYSQGWGPGVKFTDRGQVDQVGQKTCVPAKCYEDVVVIAEVSGAEKDAQQLKHFARDVGNIRVGWRGTGEKTKETLELTKVEQLSAAALAEVRAEALKLEKSAYSTSKNVYAKTSPLEPAPSAQGE